ncbi:MAG: TlpA family protein disulfide reductase [Gammaproteobacteria bacterium]|nr:TlpA family protein disulfide reductase [Gammaproteobacteria bacterium]
MALSFKQKTLFSILCCAALAAGISFAILLNNAPNANAEKQNSQVPAAAPKAPSAKALLGTRRPDFALPDLENKIHHINEFNNKVVLVNFWATWCGPCRKEIPALIKLKKERAQQPFEIVSVALDRADLTREMVKEYGINYPVLYGGADADAVSISYGNNQGLLPYSVLINAQGNIVYTHAGVLSAELLTSLFQVFLPQKPTPTN